MPTLFASRKLPQTTLMKASGNRPTLSGSGLKQIWSWKKHLLFVILYVAIFSATWVFMRGADRFLSLTPDALGKYFPVKWFLILHITGGGGALVLGPFQFLKPLQKNYPKTHRFIGKFYLLAVLVSSLCAVVLALTTAYEAGWPYAFSLQVWVTVWISCSYIGYVKARAKLFKEHKEWMTRSYLSTLAFVISGLLFKLPIVQQLGPISTVAPSLFWAGWAIPMFVYQVYLSFLKRPQAIRLK